MCSFMEYTVVFEIMNNNTSPSITAGPYSQKYGTGNNQFISISSLQLMKNSEYLIRAIVHLPPLQMSVSSPDIKFGMSYRTAKLVFMVNNSNIYIILHYIY